MPNILSEYLVKLGFQTDAPALSQFNNVLIQAEATVTRYTGGMAKKVLEAQGAIVGAFTGISSAIVGMVDKVAMADLGYQKTAIRMMMTKESARSLDMVTKALGASLEEIWWTPELRERAGEMLKHLQKLNVMLGPDFDKNMKGIRDFRFQFSQLGIDLKYLGMAFASDIFKKLFPSGDALAAITKWMDKFEQQIPHIADVLSNYAVPVLKDTWKILLGFKDVLKEGAIAFTNLIGVFSGDTAIEGASFSFKNLADALQHVENFLIRIEIWATKAETAIAHMAAAASLALHGDFSRAASEAGAGVKAGTPHTALSTGVGIAGGLLGLNAAIGITKTAGSALGLGRIGGLIARMFGGGAAAAGTEGIIGTEAAVEGLGATGGIGLLGSLGLVGVGLGAAGLADWGATKLFPKFGAWQSQNIIDPVKGLFGGGTSSAAPAPAGAWSDYRQMAAAAAISHGIDPSMFQGLIQSESGFRNVVNPASGASGLGQFTKGTAKLYGLTDRMDPAANLDAAARYMSDLLGRNGGDWSKAIAAYKGVSVGGATMGDVQKALRMGGMNPAATGASASGFRQSVDVGGVSIYVTQPGAGIQEIKRAVDDGIAVALRRQNQFDIAQLSPAWG